MDIEELKNSGVKFLPWVGEKYEFGVSFSDSSELIYGDEHKEGKKILILGESFYCADEKDAEDDLAQKIIEDYIDPNAEHEPYKNTYTKFSKALVGKDDIDREELWNHIAFYNYIQEPMQGPRMMPSNRQYADSKEPFYKVLNSLAPDYLIVWGQRLYNRLPSDDSCQGQDIEVDYDGEKYCYESWKYTLQSGKDIKVIHTNHPASGFNWEFWHKVICKGMED